MGRCPARQPDKAVSAPAFGCRHGPACRKVATMSTTPASGGTIRLPDAPVLAAGFAGAAWLDTTGEVELLSPSDAARRVAATRPILCHGPATARRLGIERFACFDLLELFAFAR